MPRINARCLRDNFGGLKWPDDGRRMGYLMGRFYDVDTEAPWAKHFDIPPQPEKEKPEASLPADPSAMSPKSSQSEKMKAYWAERKAAQAKTEQSE
jgi:hypothetical protein